MDRLKQREEYWKTMFEEQQNVITIRLDTTTKTVDEVLKTLDSLLVVTEELTQDDQNSSNSSPGEKAPKISSNEYSGARTKVESR